MTPLELMARTAAAHHGIDPALVCAVCEHESGGWQPWAVRYEPAFYDRYIASMTVLSTTEKQARAFSYGLMQIMGQTAREFGFAGNYLTELCSPVVNLEYGCRKLAKCLESSNGNVRNALLKYNGGGNAKYPDKVIPLMAKYKAVQPSGPTKDGFTA